MPEPLDPIVERLHRHYPECAIDCHDDGSLATITPLRGDERMQIDVFVHESASRGTSAYRYRTGVAIPDGDKPHYWIRVQDAQKQSLHFQVTCCLDAFLALVERWLAPSAIPPQRLCLPASASRAPIDTRPDRNIRVLNEIDSAPLFSLPDAEVVLQQLEADIADLNPETLLDHWPRDIRGRPELRTTVALNGYGPATRKRQPVLCLRSATKQQQVPELKLALSMEFLYNQRRQWKDARWLWTRAPAPAPDTTIEQARELLANGDIEDACGLFDVRLHGSVRRIASGMAISRFEPLPHSWQAQLVDALHRLAPWRLHEGLMRIQSHLAATNRKAPKPGTWERKLFWFPHQRQQAKQGLGIRLDSQGKPELFVISTAANEFFPEPDWLDLA